MSVSTCRAAVVAAIALVIPTMAWALPIWTATWSGKVVEGIDGIGVFGSPSADLTGKAFVATFSYEGSPPTGFPCGEYDHTPVCAHASFSIDGTTVPIDGQWYGRIQRLLPDYVQMEVVRQVEDPFFQYLASLTADAHLPAAISSIAANLPPTIPGENYGTFVVRTTDLQTKEYVALTYANLRTDEIRIAGSVPELDAWVLMLVGFGGVGVALRQRRALRGLRAASFAAS